MRRGGGEMPPFDIAIVCRKGHVVNDQSQMAPEQNAPFCAECGEATLDRCETCERAIRGYDHRYRRRVFRPPAYCDACGKPYPWTVAALAALEEIGSELESAEREELRRNVPDVIANTPRTPLAANAIKKVLAKAPQWVADAAKQIIVSVATEAAKQRMGL